MIIKNFIKTNPFANRFLAKIYRIISRSRLVIKGRDNLCDFNVSGLFLLHSNITIRGNNNVITFIANENGNVTHFKNLRIIINGNNNRIMIGSHSSGHDFKISIEDDYNQVVLGEHFTVGENTELAVIEGTSIEFGKDCQLSANITLRTGDSHSITNLQGKRTNLSKSIIIGNHVWIGNTALIFKGTNIADNSIVAGGSVVCGKTFPSNVIVGGNPAKIIKDGINWDRRRLPID